VPPRGPQVGKNGNRRRRAAGTLTIAVLGAIVSAALDLTGQSSPSSSQVEVYREAPLAGPFSDPLWIPIQPGTNIQTVVNSYPGATTFYLRAGVHRQQRVNPRTNNIFIGETGAVLDGENTTPYAFEATTALPQNVTIKNLEITRYASPYQGGAIQGDNGVNWVVDGNAVHDNAYIGIRSGRGWQVRRNAVYRNGVIGISGYRADEILVEDNEVYQNNWARAPEEPILAEASGIKFGVTANALLRNNNVHHNFAKGIWMDHCNPRTLIEGNAVADNSHQGISAEISDSVTIRNNVSERNGLDGSVSWLTRAGIQVTNSPNVEIYGNVVRDNANGITAMQSSGANATSGPYGPLRLENLYVHDNVVRMLIGRAGLAQNTGETQVYTTWNNRIERNTYYLGPNATYFAWNEKSLTESEWRAAGNDSTSAFIR
jgi:parallel beta-helix repeat protein